MIGMSIWDAIEIFRRHPSNRILTALHDGVLPERKRVRTQSHLDQCASCRLQASRIDQDWDQLVELNSADWADMKFAEQETIARVQASIHAWSAGHPVPAEAARRIEDVLGIYLGRRAAAALSQERGASQDSVRDALASAGSTLGILLGKKGATAIESKLLRILGRAPGSAGRSFI
jgi:hypothetical protein